MPPVLTTGPDPRPRKPKIAIPPNACDAHMHLFGPSAKYPVDPNSHYKSEDHLPETYIEMLDTLGLSTAVIVSPGAYGRDPTMLADVLTQYPDRFRGVALIPETISDAEFDRLYKLGVRGMRFMSAARGSNFPTFSKSLAERGAAHDWHVQFYPKDTDIIDYAPTLLGLPNTIVLDHFAAIPAELGPDQPAMKTILRMLDTGRVWVKMSAPMRCTTATYPFPEVTPLARALVKHAPERLVWATDWPHVNLEGRDIPNDGDLLDLLAEWVPDETTRNRILVDNPNALYRF